MIKYASNAMLATRISFMNELSLLCEKLGVDVEQVRLGIGSDQRIGSSFLRPGPGYGGSCFPKDIAALVDMGEQQGIELKIMKSVQEVNLRQTESVALKIKHYFGDLSGKKIAIWGLAFKPGTDDVRETPAKTIIKILLENGAEVFAHDPKATTRFAAEMGDQKNLHYVEKSYDALQNADALVMVTEWSEYKTPDWQLVASLMNQKAVFDFRNQYNINTLISLGFYYQCIGRPDSRSLAEKKV
jgi:UDPglucose 6-dehydrogenase